MCLKQGLLKPCLASNSLGPEDDFELVIFRPPLSQVLGLQAFVSTLEKES